MKVVLDTDVLISALIFRGGRGEQALRRILDGRDSLVLSKPIFDELLRILAAKFSREREELARVAVYLGELAEFVAPGVRALPYSHHKVFAGTLTAGFLLRAGNVGKLRLYSREKRHRDHYNCNYSQCRKPNDGEQQEASALRRPSLRRR